MQGTTNECCYIFLYVNPYIEWPVRTILQALRHTLLAFVTVDQAILLLITCLILHVMQQLAIRIECFAVMSVSSRISRRTLHATR